MNLGKVFTCTLRQKESLHTGPWYEDILKVLFSKSSLKWNATFSVVVILHSLILCIAAFTCNTMWGDGRAQRGSCHTFLGGAIDTLWVGVLQSKGWTVPSDLSFEPCCRGGYVIGNTPRVLWNKTYSAGLKGTFMGKRIHWVGSNVWSPYSLYSYCFT